MALVLAADDDPVILRLLQVNLELEGHEVILAPNGAEAVALAKARNPDVILLDVMMPELDGWGACKAIKADEALASTPVIFLSAKAQNSDVDQGVSLGAEAYITKPFDPIDLLDLIEEVLSFA